MFYCLYKFILYLGQVLINKWTKIKPMVQHAEAHMNVRLNKSRQHGHSGQINNISILTSKFLHLLVCSNFNNFIISYSHSIYFRLLVIHGVNCSINKNLCCFVLHKGLNKFQYHFLLLVSPQLSMFKKFACELLSRFFTQEVSESV